MSWDWLELERLPNIGKDDDISSDTDAHPALDGWLKPEELAIPVTNGQTHP